MTAHSFVSQSTIYFQLIPSIRRTFGHLGNRTKRTISPSKLVLRCAYTYRSLGFGLYFCWHFWPAGLYSRWGRLSIASPVNCSRRAKLMRLKPKTFSMRQRRWRRQTKQRALKAHKHVFVFAPTQTH